MKRSHLDIISVKQATRGGRRAAGDNVGTLEQPLQRTLPGMGGGGGRWGTGASAVSELWTGPEGLTGRGAMACRTVPWLGMNMVAGAWVGSAAGTAADRRRERGAG